MSDFIERATSRKFLATVFACITELTAITSGAVDVPTGVAFILATTLGYVIVEGAVDARRAAQITRTAATVATEAAVVLTRAADVIDDAAKG